jgi:Cu/Zn superoxide dismutase
MLSRKSLSYIAPVVMGLAFAACEQGADTEDALDTEAPEAVAPTEQPADMTTQPEGAVIMQSDFTAEAGQNVTGAVTVLRGDQPGGDFQVAVRLVGLMPGEHAWHIHSAACGTEAPVVVPFTQTSDEDGLASPLSPGPAGAAEQVVTVPRDRLPLEQLQAGEYSIHVHERGGVDHGPTVACANLRS